MAKRKNRSFAANTGSEEVPPGATTRAADRPLNPPGGGPGSGAGPRHAAGDEGSTEEEYGGVDSNQPAADESVAPEEETLPEEQDAYGGPSGGAVGGTPAGKRSRGGRIHGGIAPGTAHHPDTSVGVDPDEPAE